MKFIRYGVIAPLFAGLLGSSVFAADPLDLPLDTVAGTLTPVATANEADASGEPVVEHLTIHQWVGLDDNGRLNGRVVSAAGGKIVGVADAEITLLSAESEMLTAMTDADGKFVIADAGSGIYALTARSDGYFACCAMHVVDSAMPASDQVVSEALISAAAIDFTDVQTALIRYLPPTFHAIGHSVQDADLAGLKPYIATTDSFKVEQNAGGIDGFVIRPGADKANLIGAEQTNVFLFRDGSEIARATTEPNGQFRFDGVSVGDYSVVAVGADGVGAIGFELVAATNPSTVSVRGTDGTMLTQYAGSVCCGTLAMQIAPPTEVVGSLQNNVISDQVISERIIGETIVGGDIVGAPLAGAPVGGFAPGVGLGGGGGFAGGAGGGFAGGGLGGGGFAGGGIGRFAALGGVAAAIAIAASDDDDNVVVTPPVASPVVPTSSGSDSDSDSDD